MGQNDQLTPEKALRLEVLQLSCRLGGDTDTIVARARAYLALIENAAASPPEPVADASHRPGYNCGSVQCADCYPTPRFRADSNVVRDSARPEIFIEMQPNGSIDRRPTLPQRIALARRVAHLLNKHGLT